MTNKNENRRRKAAQAQAEATAAEKRRERIVRATGVAVVGVVVIGIIAVAVLARQDANSKLPAPGNVDAAAALPKGVLPATDARPFGVPYGTGAADAPVLEVWEDFQCPACGALEAANGAGITAAAEAGKVQLVYRPTAFLDRNLRTDASTRAISAWGCAIDEGKTKEFHDLVYANQPQTEGDGWTDEQLVSFGSQAGLTGEALDRFTGCVTAKTYTQWATNSTSTFYSEGIQGTPTVKIDGVAVEPQRIVDVAGLEQVIAEAAAKR